MQPRAVVVGLYRRPQRSLTSPEWWPSPTLQLCPFWPGKYISFRNKTAKVWKGFSSICSLSLDWLQYKFQLVCHAAFPLPRRAAEKLNLTSRKKGQATDPAPAHFSTCFREIIQKNPPPVPSCLLQAATRTKDSPNVGKVDRRASNSSGVRVDADFPLNFRETHWQKDLCISFHS